MAFCGALPAAAAVNRNNISCVTVGRRQNMASLKAALPSLASAPSSRGRASLTLSRGSPQCTVLGSFAGLSPMNTLFSLAGYTGFDLTFTVVETSGRISAMRHGRRVPKLNRPPDQRRALLRCLTTQLLKYGRIKTTRARASAMRKYVDKMITLAKDGSLHKRRQALGFIYEKQIVHALFAEVQDRYGERNGGYTRIIRTLPRRGDNAPMAYIELV